MISSWRRTLRWLGAKPARPLAHRQAVLDHPGEVARRDARRPTCPSSHPAADLRSLDRRRPGPARSRPARPAWPPAPWRPRRGPAPSAPRCEGPGGGGQRAGQAVRPPGPACRRPRRPGRPRKLLRLVPTSTGYPVATSSSTAASSWRLWSTVLPKPMPGSIQTSATPAAARPGRPGRPGTRSPRPPRRRRGGRPACRPGCPCRCMATQPTPCCGGHRPQRGRHVVDQGGARPPRPPRPPPPWWCRPRPARGGPGPRSPAPPGAAPRRRAPARRPGGWTRRPRRRCRPPRRSSRGPGRWPARPSNHAATVGERVRRDVEDPHDQGTLLGGQAGMSAQRKPGDGPTRGRDRIRPPGQRPWTNCMASARVAGRSGTGPGRPR